jgi:hypothetical protein
MQRLCLALVWTCFVVAGTVAEESAAADDEPGAQIRASGLERAFEAVGWIATLRDGLRKSARDARPILLWTTLGHPLGCT